jgi:polyketide synthase 12
VKSNIAHTEWAAGAVGVIKMVLALQHEELPRTLHAGEPSPHVDWSAGQVRLLTEPVPWPAGGRPRRAGISAFGISGTNAHVIVEEAPAADVPASAGALVSGGGAGVSAAGSGVVAWVVSGRSAEALAGQAGRLREFAAGRPGLDPADVGWSLVTGRSSFEHRAVVWGRDREELLAGLAAVAGEPGGAGGLAGAVTGLAGTAGKLGMVFTGQGSQRAGMGLGLRAAYPAFAAAFDEACGHLDGLLGGRVADVIAGGGALLDETVWAQAGLFAVEVALFRLLESWGIRPAAAGGHSIGELAAAHVAGVWTLPDACRVVAARGRLMQALPHGGAMIAVEADEASVLAVAREYPGIGIAAVNGPRAVVISGDAEQAEQAAQRLAAAGARTRRLRVSHAFHSPLMEPMLTDFGRELEGVSYAPPSVPLVSGLTGQLAGEEVTEPGYWVRHVREAVRFGDAAAAMRAAGVRTFVEIGPDGVLSALGAGGGDDDPQGEAWLPVLRRDRDEAAALTAAVAGVHVRGGTVDWAATYTGTRPRRVALPTYAFQRQRYWLAESGGLADAAGLGQSVAGHPVLGAVIDLPATGGLMLTGRLSAATHSWLADHVVAGQVIVPGTMLAELAVRAGDEAGCGSVRELLIEVPLVLPAVGGVQVQVTVEEAGADGDRGLAIYSRTEEEAPDGSWTRHAVGVLAPGGDPGARGGDWQLAQWPPAGAEPVSLDGFYDGLAAAGLAYGPAFAGLRRAWRLGEEVFAEVALPEGTAVAGFGVHPALWDAALHAVGLGGGLSGERGPLLPFSWEHVAVHASGASAARVRVSPAGREPGSGVSVTLADAAGALVASVGSLVLREAGDLGAGAAVVREALYEVEWAPAVAGPGATAAAVPVAVLGEGLAVPGAARFAGVAELAAAVAAGAEPPAAVLWRVPPGGAAPGGAAGQDAVPAAAAAAAAVTALGVIGEWLAEDQLDGSRLVVVTRRGTDAGPEAVPDPGQAAVCGLVRAAASENPGRVALADVDDADAAGELLAAGAGLGEPEFAVRGGQLRVPRLARARTGLPAPEKGGWRLGFTGRGSLENLALVPALDPGRELAAGEVRVGVRAAGVNFRDVLNVLGMYPGEAGMLGLEGAGVVLEAGPGVSGLAPGDRVMGLFAGAFGPVAVADARLVAPVPARWTLAQAATVPVTFLTAWHALVELGGLRAGETVLIHAAAGGVGMAAVQLARYLGAEVYATASPGKWPALLAAGIPAGHIASSRDTGFEGRCRAATGGRGVDVILDSLAGEFVDASLRLAAPGGRFLEMGKTDVRDPGAVAAAHGGLYYQAFDLLAEDPGGIAGMLAGLCGLFASGALEPLPAACWDVRRATDAFRFMSQARNVGKVVLTVPAPRRDGGTVLITGGSGELAALTARHLGGRPAAWPETARLVLLSRRGPAAPETASLAASLAGTGTPVQVTACDAADRDALAAVIAAISPAEPLATVIHAAGVLDDGVIGSLTPGRIASVMRPKAEAAWHLHELTSHLDLEAFVLFSSVAGVWGSPGQGNYAAANTFLDALAALRRSQGLPAASLSWGPWQAGMADHLTTADWQRMSRQGMRPLTSPDGMALLDAAATAPAAHLVPTRLDLAALRRQGADAPPLLSGIARTASARRTAGRDTATASQAARLAELPPDQRDQALRDLVQAHTAHVLGLTAATTIEPTRTFRDLGFDSLTAVELRNRLNTATGLHLQASLVFDYPTTEALVGYLGSKTAGQATDKHPVLGELDKLEAALAGVAADSGERAKIMARLQGIVVDFKTGSRDNADTYRELAVSTDDEIFRFIDEELES